jgi:hypothetical protein
MEKLRCVVPFFVERAAAAAGVGAGVGVRVAAVFQTQDSRSLFMYSTGLAAATCRFAVSYWAL